MMTLFGRAQRVVAAVVAAVAAGLLVAVLGAGDGVAGVPSDRRPTPTWPGPAPSQLPQITVLSVGDSLTVGSGGVDASYRVELSRLMNLTGQRHVWRVEALGGTKCSYWAARIDTIITTHAPALIFLNCGTNDVPGVDNTEADYRTILTRAAARGVKVVASKIGIPDMKSATNRVRPYILDWHFQINQAIGRALDAHPSVPWADMTDVFPSPEFLQTDGIHLNPRGEAAWGELFYRAAQPTRTGWFTLAQLGQQGMCGLNGSWPWEPWPIPEVDYRVCWS